MDRGTAPAASKAPSAARRRAGSKSSRPATVRAVRHAVEVLRCLSSDPAPLGVTEIARRIGLHKSSVSRLLATLESLYLVERDPATDRFRPGIGLISLAAPLISDLGLLDVARPYLRDLAKRSGETISLNIWDGDAAVSVEQEPGGNAIKHYAPPGMRNPAHCTAAGKALLAHASEEEIARVLGGDLTSYTPHTKVEREALQSELADIRLRGFAVNEGELVADVGAVASVVRDLRGEVVAAITATVPMYRFGAERREELVAHLILGARRLSQRLGHVG